MDQHRSASSIYAAWRQLDYITACLRICSEFLVGCEVRCMCLPHTHLSCLVRCTTSYVSSDTFALIFPFWLHVNIMATYVGGVHKKFCVGARNFACVFYECECVCMWASVNAHYDCNLTIMPHHHDQVFAACNHVDLELLQGFFLPRHTCTSVTSNHV